MGGFSVIKENKVTILVNEALSASAVDRKEAEKALKAATRRLNGVLLEKEKVEATLSFKRARVQYQVRQWRK
jgi:F0F1-type ATP synthase epsilon subunit